MQAKVLNSKQRQELEETAWAWVDRITNAEKDTITKQDLKKCYKLHFPIHISPEWKCKKNCRSNPRCYCNLGEYRWLLKQETETDKNEDDEDMSLERRVHGMPVGLKNLGNTCYVNSFLQIWFHNVPFREALYKWDPAQGKHSFRGSSYYTNSESSFKIGIILRKVRGYCVRSTF